jgi:hypothetical protein
MLLEFKVALLLLLRWVFLPFWESACSKEKFDVGSVIPHNDA